MTMKVAETDTDAAAAKTDIAAAPQDRLRLGGVGVWMILLTLAFAHPLRALVEHALNSEINSHILLIPFISAYVLYCRRKQLPVRYGSSLGWAALLLSAGFGVLSLVVPGPLWPATLNSNDALGATIASFVCLALAGGFIFLGRKWMAAAAFPMAFLFFMVPMPEAVVDALETASKLASAEVAYWFFQIAGVPILRDGTIFQLPGIVLEVAQQCSGIRSSLVLVITSLLAANLCLSKTWHRALLVAFVIPLGIVRNAFRILVIGVLCVQVGPDMIHHAIHKKGGPLFFAASLLPLFGLLWWMRRIERPKPSPEK